MLQRCRVDVATSFKFSKWASLDVATLKLMSHNYLVSRH